MIKHPNHQYLLSLPKRMFPLQAIIVQIKNQEVALPLVEENTTLVVENLLAQERNLLLPLRLLWMIPRRNVFLLFFFLLFRSLTLPSRRWSRQGRQRR